MAGIGDYIKGKSFSKMFMNKSPFRAFIQIGGTSNKNVDKTKVIDKSKTKTKVTGDKDFF